MATDDKLDYGVKQCWKEKIELLSRNINNTIIFLENDCTAEDFSWLSEVFEEVAKITQSHAFVDCINRVAKKYPAYLQGIAYRFNSPVRRGSHRIIKIQAKKEKKGITQLRFPFLSHINFRRHPQSAEKLPPGSSQEKLPVLHIADSPPGGSNAHLRLCSSFRSPGVFSFSDTDS